MPELCDLVDEAGRRIGRTALRGTFPVDGEYFPVVHLWIADPSGFFLIQKRAAHLASAPGFWATTAGYVRSGESGRKAAAREAGEELGLRINPDLMEMIGSGTFEHRWQEVWLLRIERQQLGSVSVGDEVADWRWEGLDTISAMLERGEFFGYWYFDRLIAPLSGVRRE